MLRTSSDVKRENELEKRCKQREPQERLRRGEPLDQEGHYYGGVEHAEGHLDEADVRDLLRPILFEPGLLFEDPTSSRVAKVTQIYLMIAILLSTVRTSRRASHCLDVLHMPRPWMLLADRGVPLLDRPI